MSRIAAVMAGLVVVVSLNLATKVMGQIPADPSIGTSTEPEQQTEVKKDEPNWQGMLKADNRSYLANVNRVRQELDRFQKDRLWGGMLLQMMGMEYPNVGRYRKALECFDRAVGQPAKMGQLADPDRYEPRDAVAAILELADKHQVIMINEAHHVPVHRAFTLQLLEGLYRQGFRYFAAETLSISDTNLQTRGYPTRMTGTFTAEPVCADMVRTALNLGYKVTPYECLQGPQAQPAVDPIPGMNIREQGQAKNLKERILDQDPTAKIIVHAGYAHICKSVERRKKGEVRWMALAFQELTGIEPLSIDQTEMSEKSKPEKEKPDYRFAIEKGLVKDHPVVLRDKEAGGYFVSTTNGLMYDLTVIHSRSRYKNGRPTWLAMSGRRTSHDVNTELRPPQGASYLAQAFYATEMGLYAVPIDQMEYDAEEPVPTLWLPPGEMYVRIVDDKANVLQEYTTGDR